MMPVFFEVSVVLQVILHMRDCFALIFLLILLELCMVCSVVVLVLTPREMLMGR